MKPSERPWKVSVSQLRTKFCTATLPQQKHITSRIGPTTASDHFLLIDKNIQTSYRKERKLYVHWYTYSIQYTHCILFFPPRSKPVGFHRHQLLSHLVVLFTQQSCNKNNSCDFCVMTVVTQVLTLRTSVRVSGDCLCQKNEATKLRILEYQQRKLKMISVAIKSG